jgi:hypothetical protein
MPELCPNADAVASIMAMATIVVLRMSICRPQKRRQGAEVEIQGSVVEAKRTGSDLIRNLS